MKKRLSREVTIQEMLSMREQGMTNSDIAASLECHYQTVLKYIGKQPAGFEQMAAFRRPLEKQQAFPEPTAPQAVGIADQFHVAVSKETATLGTLAVQIDYAGETVEINGELMFPFSELPDFTADIVKLAGYIQKRTERKSPTQTDSDATLPIEEAAL